MKRLQLPHYCQRGMVKYRGRLKKMIGASRWLKESYKISDKLEGKQELLKVLAHYGFF